MKEQTHEGANLGGVLNAGLLDEPVEKLSIGWRARETQAQRHRRQEAVEDLSAAAW